MTAAVAAPPVETVDLDLSLWPRIMKARNAARRIEADVAAKRDALQVIVDRRAALAEGLASAGIKPDLRDAIALADETLAGTERDARRALTEAEREMASDHYSLIPRPEEQSDWAPEGRARQQVRDAEKRRDTANHRRFEYANLKASALHDRDQPVTGDMTAAAAARETLARLETEQPRAIEACEAADQALAEARAEHDAIRQRVSGLEYRVQTEIDPEPALAELLPLVTVRRG